MGRDRKPMSKAKEKKLAAKQEAERKRAERAALVAAANGAADPLAALPSFKKFNKNGLDVALETRRVADLEDHVREWVMDLLKANMKEAYEKSREEGFCSPVWDVTFGSIPTIFKIDSEPWPWKRTFGVSSVHGLTILLRHRTRRPLFIARIALVRFPLARVCHHCFKSI